MDSFRELSQEEMQQIEGGDLWSVLLTIGAIFFIFLEFILLEPFPTDPP